MGAAVEIDLSIPTARAFVPLLGESRYKGAHGGRGSGKSQFFAELGVDRCAIARGVRMVCIREHQASLKESAKKLIENKIQALGVGHLFQVLTTEIRTPGGGVIIFQGMQDHTAESIKSLEDFDIAWVEEAQTLSAKSLEMLRPTIRAAGSELWFSWNPRRKTDPVDLMFRGETTPTGSIVVQSNWSDNPWFPDVLEQERIDCLNHNPEHYDHIWEGGYLQNSHALVLSGKVRIDTFEAFSPEGELLYTETVDNIVVNVGLDDALDKYLKGSAYTAAHYVGLTSGTPTVNAANTMSSHAGWTEVVAYTESTREVLTLGTVASQTVNNSASKASFAINADATTIGGAFICTNSTKSGTSGTLYSVAALTGGNLVLSNGSTLNITVTCTAAAS